MAGVIHIVSGGDERYAMGIAVTLFSAVRHARRLVHCTILDLGLDRQLERGSSGSRARRPWSRAFRYWRLR